MPPISDSYQTGPFETFLARWSDQVNGLVEGVQSWSQNKLDADLDFNFATAQTDLENALKTFMSSLETVLAM